MIDVVKELTNETLDVYRTSRRRVEEDANSERRISQGGYHEHSLRELVQNGLDEMRASRNGRISVVLTDTRLYCANTGEPVSPVGAETILRMGVSRKRGGQVGRFGVGVKSVLSVTDAPQFFSRTGSFGFDRQWSRTLIESVQEGVLETPVLRLGRPLDEEVEREQDEILDGLFNDGATTVVRLPLLPGAAERLGREIGGFPPHFPLFSPHVENVVFRDERNLPKRTFSIRAEHDGVRHLLTVKQPGTPLRKSEWRVFTTAHTPSAEAHQHAGELQGRPEVDISWAVPEYVMDDKGLLTVPNDRGQFWAYFPTSQRTTLSGYLNAPWKTSEDRGALYEDSPYNTEMLKAAASFVAGTLQELTEAVDPGAYLMLLPGRTNESPNPHDRTLVETFWHETTLRPSLPDQDGVLRLPADLHFHPVLPGFDKEPALQRECLQLWSDYPGRPADWLHPSVYAHRDRYGKVKHVLDAARKERETVTDWLEALVGDRTAHASATAIRIAARLHQRATDRGAGPEWDAVARDIRAARIVLTERDGFVAVEPTNVKVFRRSVEDDLPHTQVYVSPEVTAFPGVDDLLTVLGIHEADATGRFKSVLSQGFHNYTAESWTSFWELMRSAGKEALVELRSVVPDPRSTLHVRTTNGQFRPMNDCLLPGAVVPEDGSRDGSIAVDMRFHTDDRSVLAELGLRDRPSVGLHDPAAGEWFDEYRDLMYDQYCKTLPDTASRPLKSRMRLEGSLPAGPLHLLPRLSDEGRAAFVAALPDEGVVESWKLHIGSNASHGTSVISPLRWFVRRHGLVATREGLLPLREALGPQLSAFRDMLPVAEGISPIKATKLRMPTTLDKVPQRVWDGLFARVALSTDDTFVGSVYALMMLVEADFPEDEGTRCRVGNSWESRPDEEIAVTSDRAEYDTLVRERVPALLVPGRRDVERMVEEWGMLRVSEVISKELRHVPAGEPKSLVDEFPPLRDIQGRGADSYRMVICSELEQITRTPNGTRADPLQSALADPYTVLLVEPKNPVDALVAADREFGWRLGAERCRHIVETHRKRLEDRETQARLAAIRDTESISEKLLLLIGEDALRGVLPEGLLESERQESGTEPSGLRVAELAYFAHGDEVLRLHAKDLAANFPDHAPSTFGGSTSAVRFVTGLGFPEEFAGARAPVLRPREAVNGPSEFPALHPYQEKLAANLFEMLQSSTPQRRMLSLPTGAGKTRVAAEAVIRWIRQGGADDAPVLWIAQTEELCEQAVQSWMFVWSKVGAGSQLVVDRLWSSNEATDVTGRPHLVVATDAKLRVCLNSPEYAWLRRAALVIVDEAHVAQSKEYTELLSSLDLTHRQTTRHLLGLTATPFRSNSEETRLLVQRFSTPGRPRLDEGVFQGDPYEELQRLGMLAQVEHRVLDGGTIQLNALEQEKAQLMKVLPKSAERRLADDQDRNGRLVDVISEVEPQGPVLLFATSVAHAKVMAAKLNSRGLRAASIDSATPTQERRNRIEAFRKGNIRVLTNYGVLTQGFDAPATRTVVVARPVYSANVYQQMIGRGLRGPKNGGKERCLILNVADTVNNFGEHLAFKGFEYLWSPE